MVGAVWFVMSVFGEDGTGDSAVVVVPTFISRISVEGEMGHQASFKSKRQFNRCLGRLKGG